MPHLMIEFARNIAVADVAQKLLCFLPFIFVDQHGIVAARNEENGEHGLLYKISVFIVCLLHEAEKVFKAVAGKCKIAVRIGVIRFDNRFIARQPGALSFAGEFLIPVARRKLCQGIASVPLTLDQSHAFGHCHARGRKRILLGEPHTISLSISSS